MACPTGRIYPLRQPKNHMPPIPRWLLRFPENQDRVYTIYIGLQKQGSDEVAVLSAAKAKDAIVAWIREQPPTAHEAFTVLEGDDELRATVWVCYYSTEPAYSQAAETLCLSEIHANLASRSNSATHVGLWAERFSTPLSRLETNYSGLDYLPGLARLPDTTTKEHKLTAYWGAARDRIPDSGHDLFARADDAAATTAPPAPAAPRGLGQRLSGANYANMVHIRSGQFWDNCDADEARAYEADLEPTLLNGLRYLWGNRDESGTVGLRFLRNIEPPPLGAQQQHEDRDGARPRRETCGAGFFRSLGDLEAWAEKHPSHKAIFLGAIKHAKRFGGRRRMRTWHEVSVLKAGEARFEYVNCTPRTGVVRFLRLDAEEI